jgi:hypothetical protein
MASLIAYTNNPASTQEATGLPTRVNQNCCYPNKHRSPPYYHHLGWVFGGQLPMANPWLLLHLLLLSFGRGCFVCFQCETMI